MYNERTTCPCRTTAGLMDTLTFGHHAANRPAHERRERPTRRSNRGRLVPLLNVRLPELGAFAAGLDGLLPDALACDADIAGEEEVDYARDLAREEEERRICNG